jgi:hypothetical protein
LLLRPDCHVLEPVGLAASLAGTGLSFRGHDCDRSSVTESARYPPIADYTARRRTPGTGPDAHSRRILRWIAPCLVAPGNGAHVSRTDRRGTIHAVLAWKYWSRRRAPGRDIFSSKLVTRPDLSVRSTKSPHATHLASFPVRRSGPHALQLGIGHRCGQTGLTDRTDAA